MAGKAQVNYLLKSNSLFIPGPWQCAESFRFQVGRWTHDAGDTAHLGMREQFCAPLANFFVFVFAVLCFFNIVCRWVHWDGGLCVVVACLCFYIYMY